MLYIRVIISVLLISSVLPAKGQCPTAQFNLPSEPLTVCRDEPIRLTNTSVNGDQYLWDFCSGDLLKTPTAAAELVLSGGSSPRGIGIAEENGIWYAFITSRNNRLFRLTYDDGLTNAPTDILNMGDFGGTLSTPEGLEMIKENNTWYAIIHNSGNGSLVRLNFQNGLGSFPSAEVTLGSGMPSSNGNLDLKEDNGSVVLVVTNFSTNQLVIVNFGSSVLNDPGPSDIITTPALTGASGLADVSLIRSCNNWYGFSIANSSRHLFRLEFGSSLFSLPAVVDLGTTNFGTQRPFRVQVEKDSGQFVGFATTSNGNFIRFELGDNVTNPVQSSIDFGNYGLLFQSFSLKMVRDEFSNWIALTSNSNLNLNRIEFPNNCFASPAISTDFEPTLAYSEQGVYSIDLEVRDNNGNVSDITKEVTTNSLLAPDIDFSVTNICVASTINFTSLNTSGDITGYSWDFGDTNSSTAANPSHNYASTGDYTVELVVNSSNGCRNLESRQITIFPEPVPSFSPPASIICTNQSVNFLNTTAGDFGGNETWEWQVDGMPVNNTRDLDQQFVTSGMKEIRLVASIPGCSNEVAQNITVQEGPIPSFTVDDACAGTLMDFTNTSTGNIISHHWDFDNGFTSSLENPSLEYSAPGSYNVSLTVESDQGCVTTEQNLVTVFANPIVQFDNNLSCSQNVTQFNDLSTVQNANITAWVWDFDDPASGNNISTIRDATHTFSSSGDFLVKLVATSLFGCRDSAEQVVSVLPSPIADFDPDRICISEPVNFLDRSTPPPGGNLTAWEWDLAGQFSNEQNPTATFNVPLDYDITLFVTSDNLCVGTTTQTINIATAPEVVFGTEFECDNEPVKFFDLTDAGTDQIVSRLWDFDGLGQSSDSTALFPFGQEGSYTVSLEVETENGCEYDGQSNVVVNPAPQASFLPSATFGAPPLSISFTNQSAGASTFQWTFEEGAGATDVDPSHTYETLGTFEAQLVALSDNLCKDTTTQSIFVLIPDLEIELNTISLVGNEEQSVILTITNNGTLTLDNLSAFVDLGGNVNVRESINKVIAPGQTLNHTLQLAIRDNSLPYICVELSNNISGINDSEPLNNMKCQSFEGINTVISTPYPNPVTDFIRMNVVSDEAKTFTIELLGSTGSLARSYEIALTSGFNDIQLDVSGMRQGLYLLRTAGSGRTYRVFINR